MNPAIVFGEWLRQRREELGLTRKEFAGRVGCSVSTLRKIENGQRRPSSQIAALIANCLDIPPAERSTLIRVARGDLSVDRLPPLAKPISVSAASPASKTPRTNLPVFPTPLIGREHEVAELSALLHDPQCRLLTLVGPGGIGKTRLAIETASHMQGVFADGVYFVPLAAAASTGSIVPVIADAVGFTFQGAGFADPQTQLFSCLRERQTLLLIDNLEHLLTEPGIQVLADLLANALQVKLLVTSRESSGLPGEWVFEVQGLPVPERGFVEDNAQNTSVELFLQRARRAYVGFDPTPEDYPAILRICQLVEGMPLAIELAAAWVRTLSCQEIAQEIERGLDFLTVSTRDLPHRHRSMRAVFDQSWRRLTEEERRVLRRLSVFRGGFLREAAEQVGEASLSVLSTLVAKSLIRHSASGRYDLHELIRQYVTSRLANSAFAERSAQRHSGYYLNWLERSSLPLRDHRQKGTIAELTIEVYNLRAAWNWAVAHLDLVRICEASPALWYFLELRCWFVEGETIFQNAAETIQSHAMEIQPMAETLIAMNIMRAHSAYFAFRLGKSEAAYAALLPSATYLQSSDNQTAGMYALVYLGIVCWGLGRFAEARNSLQGALQKARASGARWHEIPIEEYTGIVSHDVGEYPQARRHLTEALAMAREMGDPMLIAHILGFLSRTLRALGETAEAEKCLRESLTITQEIGYRSGMGNALDGLGLIVQAINPEEARGLFASSFDVYRELGDLRNQSRVLSHQGYNFLDADNAIDAQRSFLAALRLAHKGGYMPYALDALVGLATLQAKQGPPRDALELLLIVLSHPGSSEETKDRASHLLNKWEAQLTSQQVQAARARAGSRTVEAAVEELLEQV